MDAFSQNNQGPPQVSGYQPAGMPELLLRSAGTLAPLVAHTISNRRYPTIGTNLAGLAAGLAGGTSGVFGQELANQRMDPVAQQLRVGQQLQALGTKPLAPPKLGPDTTFSLPAEGQPTLPGAPLTPGPGIAGQPTFDISNIPQQYQIAFAPQLAPLQAMKESESKLLAQQAAIRASEAATATSTAELPGIAARTKLTGLQAEELQRATADKARQDTADKALRDFFQANPNASPTALATKAAQLGASKDAIEPLVKTLDTMNQIDYRTQMLGIHRAEQGRLAIQFKQTMDKGDVDSARQIVAAQVRGLSDTMKESRNRIQVNQKILDSYTALPEQKERASAEIAADRTQIGLDAKDLKERQDTLAKLFAQTKSGAAVIQNMPTLPTAGASGSWMTELPPAAASKDKVVQDDKGGWLRSDGKSWLPIPKPAWAR